MKGSSTLTSYAASIDPAEPVFVVVVMAMASFKPVLRFGEACLAKVASLSRSSIFLYVMIWTEGVEIICDPISAADYNQTVIRANVLANCGTPWSNAFAALYQS
jgi:hypothetical protein